MAKNQTKNSNKNRKNAKYKSSQGNRNVLAVVLVLILIAVGIGGAIVLSNRPAQEQAGLTAFPAEIKVQEAYDLYQSGVFLLDVRTQGEWDEIHVPNATLIPLDELESRLNELPKDQEIVVMCRSGNRSQTGRDILRSAGFKSVTSMDGGIVDWKAAGYPTVP